MTRNALPGTLLALSVATGAFAAPPSLDMSSFHAKLTTTTSAGEGKSFSMKGEIWARDKQIRMNMTGPMGSVSNLVTGGTAWIWQAAQKQGMKTAVNSSNSSSSLVGANDCLKNATSGGSETIEGTATEKWVYKDCGGQKDVVTSVWIAKGKRLPKKMEVRSPQGTSTTIYNEIETGAKIDDALFVPPKDVVFKDMAEVMKMMRQGSAAPGQGGSPHPPMK
jgi:outer membrane lipoprotein-sorting protein